jgi:hypothetical protein
MNRFMGYISQCFGQKDLSHYPELFRKNRHEPTYTIALSNSVVFYDVPKVPRSLNWESF